MIESEALEILKKPSTNIKVEKDECVFTSDFVKAYELAINALEKQIEKRPIYKEGECYKRAKGGSEVREIIPECPNCHSIALKHSFPCRCGQRLKWGVIDD